MGVEMGESHPLKCAVHTQRLDPGGFSSEKALQRSRSGALFRGALPPKL